MRPCIGQALEAASSSDETVILCLDQTQVSDRFGILSLSLRFGGRVLPLLWRVRKGKGNIGSDIYEQLPEKIRTILPAGSRVLLLGDRFCGQASLTALYLRCGWNYRLRLNDHLIFLKENVGEASVGNLAPPCRERRSKVSIRK